MASLAMHETISKQFGEVLQASGTPTLETLSPFGLGWNHFPSNGMFQLSAGADAAHTRSIPKDCLKAIAKD